jgi:hypothetical protein
MPEWQIGIAVFPLHGTCVMQAPQIFLEWKRFLSGWAVENVVRPMILDSWTYCAKAGLIAERPSINLRRVKHSQLTQRLQTSVASETAVGADCARDGSLQWALASQLRLTLERIPTLIGFIRLRCKVRRTARSVPTRALPIATSRVASCASNSTLGRLLRTTLIRQI